MLPLSLECGMDTVSWNAALALRTRVSMSAMGSVIDMDGPCSFLATVPMQHGPSGGLVGHHARRGPIAKSVGCSLVRARSDRKSTRLNSSHVAISYAVFCLKKKVKSM